MTEYQKINSLYKRDGRGKFIEGEWSCEEFGYLYELPWVWTEKVDGTNIRIQYADPSSFRGNEHAFIAGRTDNAQLPPFLLNHLVDLARTTPFEKVFPDADSSVVLYGEGYGARIQKGGGNYNSEGVGFVLFDVKVGEWWLRREDVEDVAANLGLDVVPIVNTQDLAEAEAFVAAGFKSAWGDFNAEGIVATPEVPLFNRGGERIITKLKTKDYHRA